MVGALVGTVFGYFYPRLRIGKSPFNFGVMPIFDSKNVGQTGVKLNLSYGF